MIITKPAGALQPGDIRPNPRRTILRVDISGQYTTLVLAYLGHPAPGMAPIPMTNETFNLSDMVKVEVPDQAATDADLPVLVAAARHLIDHVGGDSGEGWTWRELQGIVDRVAPVPPTMDEVLRTLAAILEDPVIAARTVNGAPLDEGRYILDRARRTGLLDNERDELIARRADLLDDARAMTEQARREGITK